MSSSMSTSARLVVLFIVSLVGVPTLSAQIGVGTWARDSSGHVQMTMTVETCCGANGRRLTYHIPMKSMTMELTVDSPFDGSEAPVMMSGKPTGETMAIKWLDDHHTFTVLKMNGKPLGTSKASLSADRKKLTVENDMSVGMPGQQAGKTTEVWVKQ
jgi:hypothetical protein